MVPTTRGTSIARPTGSRAGSPLDHRTASIRIAASSLRVEAINAAAVPRCRTMSNVRADWSLRIPMIAWARKRWAVEETGTNSVSPWMTPRIKACEIDIGRV